MSIFSGSMYCFHGLVSLGSKFWYRVLGEKIDRQPWAIAQVLLAVPRMWGPGHSLDIPQSCVYAERTLEAWHIVPLHEKERAPSLRVVKCQIPQARCFPSVRHPVGPFYLSLLDWGPRVNGFRFYSQAAASASEPGVLFLLSAPMRGCQAYFLICM